MKIELVHPFIYKCHDLKQLLEDTNKMSLFCSKLEKQSLLFPNRYNSEKYKGDGFELLIECLIKLSPIDNRIGINNYEPILKEDVGVDGKGIGINDKIATVQIKYRSNHNQLLNSNDDHLSNFTSASFLHFKIDIEDKNNMLIFTTAKDLAPFTKEEMFMDKVRCIGYEKLRELIDNNNNFWNLFRELSLGNKE